MDPFGLLPSTSPPGLCRLDDTLNALKADEAAALEPLLETRFSTEPLSFKVTNQNLLLAIRKDARCRGYTRAVPFAPVSQEVPCLPAQQAEQHLWRAFRHKALGQVVKKTTALFGCTHGAVEMKQLGLRVTSSEVNSLRSLGQCLVFRVLCQVRFLAK